MRMARGWADVGESVEESGGGLDAVALVFGEFWVRGGSALSKTAAILGRLMLFGELAEHVVEDVDGSVERPMGGAWGERRCARGWKARKMKPKESIRKSRGWALRPHT